MLQSVLKVLIIETLLSLYVPPSPVWWKDFSVLLPRHRRQALESPSLHSGSIVSFPQQMVGRPSAYTFPPNVITACLLLCPRHPPQGSNTPLNNPFNSLVSKFLYRAKDLCLCSTGTSRAIRMPDIIILPHICKASCHVSDSHCPHSWSFFHLSGGSFVTFISSHGFPVHPQPGFIHPYATESRLQQSTRFHSRIPSASRCSPCTAEHPSLPDCLHRILAIWKVRIG